MKKSYVIVLHLHLRHIHLKQHILWSCHNPQFRYFRYLDRSYLRPVFKLFPYHTGEHDKADYGEVGEHYLLSKYLLKYFKK